jgi:two-component system, NarL family, nitrate/nitrite response regulator NarL
MRLVVCDANRILCEALAAALESCGHQVLATTTTVDDCIEAVSSRRPDVCELDLHLPDPEDGLQAVREIRCRCPGTAVLVISDLKDPDIRQQVRGLGVAGLVGKDRSVSQIAEALRMIDRGKPVFDPAPVLEPPAVAAVPILLTPREAEVLRRLVAGQDTRQMAREMNIAISTLRTYVRNLLAKLGAHSRLEAAAVASRGDLPAELCAAGELPAAGQQGFLHSA